MTEKDKNAEVEIAVLAAEFKHLSDVVNTLKETFSSQMGSLSAHVKSFIDISDRKVDRESYMEDKKHFNNQILRLQEDIKSLQDYRRTQEAVVDSATKERKKIWGISSEMLRTIISLLTLITLVAAVSQIVF
jgi:predicted  nucleic acid-binding Zn-ribbon protein